LGARSQKNKEWNYWNST